MTDDVAPLPFVDAVVIDARAERHGRPALGATCDVALVSLRSLDRFAAAATPHTFLGGTRDRIELGRGVDVIVVVAGPDVAGAARDARILVSLGAKAGIIIVPPGSASGDETAARHLLTGVGLDGNDALAGDPDDAARLAARACPPGTNAFPTSFLAVARPAWTRSAEPAALHGRVIVGAADKRRAVRAHVLFDDGFGARTIEMEPASAQTWFRFGPHPFHDRDEVVMAAEPLPFGRDFVVGDAFSSLEPCIAFAGNGGFASGTVGGGWLRLDRPVCPRNGKIGIVTMKGAGLGPVKTVEARVLTSRRSREGDRDELFELMKAAMFDAVVATYGPWDEVAQRERWATRFKAGDAEVCCDDAGRIFAELIVETRPDELYVTIIHVHPRDQGRGVGAALMRQVLDRARAEKMAVALQVLKVSPRAMRFYERLGFRPVGETETHILMRATT